MPGNSSTDFHSSSPLQSLSKIGALIANARHPDFQKDGPFALQVYKDAHALSATWLADLEGSEYDLSDESIAGASGKGLALSALSTVAKLAGLRRSKQGGGKSDLAKTLELAFVKQMAEMVKREMKEAEFEIKRLERIVTRSEHSPDMLGSQQPERRGQGQSNRPSHYTGSTPPMSYEEYRKRANASQNLPQTSAIRGIAEALGPAFPMEHSRGQANLRPHYMDSDPAALGMRATARSQAGSIHSGRSYERHPDRDSRRTGEGPPVTSAEAGNPVVQFRSEPSAILIPIQPTQATEGGRTRTTYPEDTAFGARGAATVPRSGRASQRSSQGPTPIIDSGQAHNPHVTNAISSEHAARTLHRTSKSFKRSSKAPESSLHPSDSASGPRAGNRAIPEQYAWEPAAHDADNDTDSTYSWVTRAPTVSSVAGPLRVRNRAPSINVVPPVEHSPGFTGGDRSGFQPSSSRRSRRTHGSKSSTKSPGIDGHASHLAPDAVLSPGSRVSRSSASTATITPTSHRRSYEAPRSDRARAQSGRHDDDDHGVDHMRPETAQSGASQASEVPGSHDSAESALRRSHGAAAQTEPDARTKTSQAPSIRRSKASSRQPSAAASAAPSKTGAVDQADGTRRSGGIGSAYASNRAAASSRSSYAVDSEPASPRAQSTRTQSTSQQSSVRAPSSRAAAASSSVDHQQPLRGRSRYRRGSEQASLVPSATSKHSRHASSRGTQSPTLAAESAKMPSAPALRSTWNPLSKASTFSEIDMGYTRAKDVRPRKCHHLPEDDVSNCDSLAYTEEL